MEQPKENVAATNAPERIEIPVSEGPALGQALQRYQMATGELRTAQTELENVRLRTLLAARVDRPELYQLDVSTVPPSLHRMGVAGQTPGEGVPAPAVEAPSPNAGPTPAARRHAKVTAIKEVSNGRRKR